MSERDLNIDYDFDADFRIKSADWDRKSSLSLTLVDDWWREWTMEINIMNTLVQQAKLATWLNKLGLGDALRLKQRKKRRIK